MHLIAVIPAYNEERTIGNVVAKISNFQYPISNIRTIVVDDGSTDRTAEIARQAGAVVVRHPINRGLGAALATGIEGALRMLNQPPLNLPLSKGEKEGVIVTLDADGQHDPAEIPRLIEPIVSGKAEVVIGSRFHNKSLALSGLTKLSFGQSQTNPPLKVRGGLPAGLSADKAGKAGRGSYEMPIMRRIANLLGNLFTWLLFGLWVSDSQSGFRVFRADVAAKLRLRTSTMEVSSEIIREIARLKLRFAEVSVAAHYTPYSLAKGQGFFRGLETLWKLIVLRYFR